MRVCLECGNKLLGREDKKFCDDNCRNTYNNKINKDSNNLMRNINNRLRKNYRILKDENPTGKTRVSKTKLLQKGLDFDLFTSIYKTKAGTVYHFVYDQGYMFIDDNYLLVVHRT